MTDDEIRKNVFAATQQNIHADPAKWSEMERQMAETWGNGDKTWKPGLCLVFGTQIDMADSTEIDQDEENVFVRLLKSMIPTVCDDAQRLVDAHYDPTPMPPTENPLWSRLCPSTMAKWIIDRSIPAMHNPKWRKITRWTPESGKGLIILGGSGIGKTTALWDLYRSLESAGKPTPEIITGPRLARICSRAAKDNETPFQRKHPAILAIDDLGKEKLTETVATGIWEVVDHRYLHGLPILVTTRFASTAFESRFLVRTMGQDIAGRLREMCEAVCLGGGVES